MSNYRAQPQRYFAGLTKTFGAADGDDDLSSLWMRPASPYLGQFYQGGNRD